MNLETSIIKMKKRKRWVIYNGEVNASKITSDWYSWIHYTTNETPSEKKYKKHSWQKPHAENKTGTKDHTGLTKYLKKIRNSKNMKLGSLNLTFVILMILFNFGGLNSQENINLQDLEPTFEQESDSTESQESIENLKIKSKKKNTFLPMRQL